MEVSQPGLSIDQQTPTVGWGGFSSLLGGKGQEKAVVRWGGLLGILGGIIFVASIIYQVAFIGTGTTASGSGPIIRFPGLQTQIEIGQTLFLIGTLLMVPLMLALYRSLRLSSLAPALFGLGLSFLGLAVLAVESEPNVAMAQISAQYHAAGATAAQQAAAVIVWQATQGMFNEFDTCAYIFLSVGFIFLGTAMWKALGYGKALGAVTAAIGVVGLIGVASFPVTSASFALPAALTFVVFPLLVGWKVFALSRGPQTIAPMASP
ncbi:MAG TPA: hypothetical protein VGV89_05845 [Thermoplasmata archaeon]|nr:hypothetical protein [Thermoplasmata archaeon]